MIREPSLAFRPNRAKKLKAGTTLNDSARQGQK
jgi:hypothetical protein